jgi:hypothetical protein
METHKNINMNYFYLKFCPTIWHNSELKLSEKLILNFIWNFEMQSGYCYATNEYIAEVFGMSPERIKLTVDALKSKNYINYIAGDYERCMVCLMTYNE